MIIENNHYRLIAVVLSRQKELDADPKAIQQTEFVGQLKKLDDDDNGTDASNDQSMFLLTILERIKQKRLKFSQGNVTVLYKMANYQEAKVKLTNMQVNILKSAVKNKAGTMLRLNKKNYEDEELPHELFLTKRQTTKMRNAFVIICQHI